MICRRCALRLKMLRPIHLAARQHLNTLANPRPAPGPDHDGPPAATSTGAAQPFTTPLTPAPKGKEPAAPQPPRSSLPAGTRLSGLNYLKNKEDPLALEDHEYPEWLWSLLDETKSSGTVAMSAEGDAYAKSKKQRQIAARAARKAEKERSGDLFPKIPIEQQTTDLPSGDGTPEGVLVAEQARAELNLAMRKSRRKTIKERNYLGGMP